MAARESKDAQSWLLKRATEFRKKAGEREMPVLVRRLVELAGIGWVDFCDLPSEGLLTTFEGGFGVYINPRGRFDCDDLRSIYEQEAEGNLLPPRIRFSIAHEVAHTIYYSKASPESRPEIRPQLASSQISKDFSKREAFCNKLARQLLLPRVGLKQALGCGQGLTAETLMNLAENAGVSLEPLIYRLTELFNLYVEIGFCGKIGLYEDNGGTLERRELVTSPLCTGDGISRFKLDDYLKNLPTERVQSGWLQECFGDFTVTVKMKGTGKFRKALVVVNTTS